MYLTPEEEKMLKGDGYNYMTTMCMEYLVKYGEAAVTGKWKGKWVGGK